MDDKETGAMYDRLRAVETKVSTHEAVCAERYSHIMSIMSTTNKIIMTIGFMLFAGMATILVQIVFE